VVATLERWCERIDDVRTDLPHRHLREVSEVIEVPFLVLRL
jgi:hypothetical protein